MSVPCDCYPCAKVYVVGRSVRHQGVAVASAILKLVDALDTTICPRSRASLQAGLEPYDEPSTPPFANMTARCESRELVIARRDPFQLALMPMTSVEIAALQQRIPPSNVINKLPGSERIRTVFTRTKHDYYIDGELKNAKSDPPWYSPSGIIHKIYEPFDAPSVARRLAYGKNPKYMNMSAEDILAAWDANRNRGSAKHNGMDKWLQHEPLVTDDPDENPIEVPPPGFFRSIAWLLQRFEIYGTEVELFIERYAAYGVADLIGRERATGHLWIMDFKNCTDEDLGRDESKARGKGIHPLTRHFADTKLNHYRWQLSMYRDMLVDMLAHTKIVVSVHMLLLNYRPEEPESFTPYDLEALDLTAFWGHMPWRADDPFHRLPANPVYAATATLMRRVPDDDPRAQGRTTRMAAPFGPLERDMVWTAGPYEKGPRCFPDSPWKHPTRKWFGKPPVDIAASYEVYLLNAVERLKALPTLCGKRLVCWCRDASDRCPCDVLVKYANVYENDPVWRAEIEALRHE